MVKAYHRSPSTQWTQDGPPVTVAMCGDDLGAVEATGVPARDLGGIPAVVGGLERARRLKEVAGFTIGPACAVHDPNAALPRAAGPAAA